MKTELYIPKFQSLALLNGNLKTDVFKYTYTTQNKKKNSV